MPNLRAIATIAVPAVTAFLGLLWFLSGRKRPPNQQKSVEPPDKKKSEARPEETIGRSLKSDCPNGDGAISSPGLSQCDEQLHKMACVGQGDVQEQQTGKQTSKSSIATGAGEACLMDVSNVGVGSDTGASEDGVAPAVESSVQPEVQIKESVPVVETMTLAHEKSLESGQTDIARCDELLDEQIEEETIAADSNTLQATTGAVKGALESQIIVTEHIEPSQSVVVETSIVPTSQLEVAQGIQTGDMSESMNISDEKPSVQEDTIQNVSDNVLCEALNSDNAEQLHQEKQADLTSENTSNSANLSELAVENTNNNPNESMSRSWHEEVDETCGFDDADTSLRTNSFEESYSTSKTDKKSSPTRTKSSPPRRKVTPDRKTSTSPVHKSNEISSVNTNNSDSSSNCDNLSEASSDSGKGGSVVENHQNISSDEERIFEFNIPSELCGLFIGTRGKTIKTIREQSGTRIRLRNNPYTPDFQICVVEGPQSAVDKALEIIRRKFPNIKYPGMDLNPISSAPVIMPEIMQLNLPEGVMVDVVVSSIVDAGRVFVQQPTHPSFPSLDRLNVFMSQCYIQEGAVPDIPRPIESGVICAAPMLNGWYRAEIMAFYDDTDECDIKYVDYGGYTRIKSQCLKQIRSDFMTLPFEAVECYLANITPMDDESYFSTEAAVVLEELTQGKLLQVQVVGHAEDGVPYVHMYQIGGGPVRMVNREMVSRGVARWVEAMS